MFNEVAVPFSLDDLPDGESLPLSDVDAFIPYLTERWPERGRPHRVVPDLPGKRRPKGVDGYVVFRIGPAPRDEAGDEDARRIDWDEVLKARLEERPPKGDGGGD
ncbi:hypothetical protein ACM0CQ_15780 [Mycobacteroides abscessus subsp. abscessus]|uniref:hypothetical protein n=1 Tax=Mycobacteroides abscessus TaxID=36809 RepID=UPI0039EEFCFF